MTTVMISEIEGFGKRGLRFGNRFIGLEIHLFVFDAVPEALHKHIVPPTALCLPADGDVMAL